MPKKTVRHHRIAAPILTSLVVWSIIGIVIAAYVFRFLQTFSVRKWDGNTNFIMLSVSTLHLSVYSPFSKSITTYVLPQDAYFTVPGGYGAYKLKDILELSQSESKGEVLLVQAVSSDLGIPIDATPSTLTEADRWILWYLNLTYEKEETPIDLAEEQLFSEEFRPDRETIFVVDQSMVDRYFKDRLWERPILQEDIPVGVFNASGKAGVASSITRILERVGIKVVTSSNWNEQSPETCKLNVSGSAQTSVTLQRIKKIYDCPVEIIEENRFGIMLIVS